MTCGCWTCLPCWNEWGAHQAWLLALIPDYLCQSNPETGKKWQKKGDYLTLVGDCGTTWRLESIPACSQTFTHKDTLTIMQKHKCTYCSNKYVNMCARSNKLFMFCPFSTCSLMNVLMREEAAVVWCLILLPYLSSHSSLYPTEKHW